MIEGTRRWFRRHRNKLLVGAGVVGVGYVAGSYVLGKIQEARQRMSEERIAKENLRRRFEQNQEDCTYTVLALLPTVRDEIISSLPVEQITEQLQQERQQRLKRGTLSEAASSEFPSAPPSTSDEDARSLASLQSSYVHASQVAHSQLDVGTAPRPKRSKAQLWQDMKINSIARAMSLIYALCLLTLLTRIQLNLLGRRTYLSSVVALATPPAPSYSSTISLENKDDDNYDNVYGTDFETNRKYLTFSWWLLHRGSKQILERVLAAVKEVFGAVNIREDMSLEHLSSLIMQVRMKIEGATEEERRSNKWLAYVLPASRDDEALVIKQAGMSESSDDSPSPEARPISDPLSSASSALAAEDLTIHPPLRRLLDETADLADSPTFAYVLTRLLDAAFSHLVDFRLATEAYKIPGPMAPGTVTELADDAASGVPDHPATCKLAHILPVFCRQAHVIAVGSSELDAMAAAAGAPDDPAAGGLGNEYLAAVDQVPDLEAFAAVIYSSHFDYELSDPTPAAADADLPPPPSSSSTHPAPGPRGSATAPPPADSDVLVLSAEQQPLAPPPPAHPDFESVWQKATSSEHGQDHDDDNPHALKLL